MREFISKVQNQRKANDYEVTDHIAIAYDAEGTVKDVLEAAKAEICDETLAESMTLEALDGDDQDLNGETVRFQLKKL